MTIRHNNHYWDNIASDGAVMVGGNSLFPPPHLHKVGFPNKQKWFHKISSLSYFLLPQQRSSFFQVPF